MLRTLLFATSLLVGACGAVIGDECESSVDCSPEGERICDLAQSGGYCTIKNCTADTCPDDARCVQFGSEPRFERRYCMAACESEGDCRGGRYSCVAPADNDSSVIDQHSGSYCVESSSE